MNKLLLVGSFLLSFAMNYAQDSKPESKAHWGAKGGLNVAYIPEVLKEIKKNDPKVGFHIGGMFMYDFSKKAHLITELYFSQQGTKTLFVFKNDNFPNGVDVNGDFSLNYITIPVQFQWNFSSHWNASAGPYFGFLVNKKVHVYTPSYVQEQYGISVNESGDIDDVAAKLTAAGYTFAVKTHKTDIGINLNLGYAFNEKWGINGRYSIGLVNLLDAVNDSYKATPKNSVFALSCYYWFR